MNRTHIKLVGAANAWLAVVAGLADGRVVVIRGDACLVAWLLPTTSCMNTLRFWCLPLTALVMHQWCCKGQRQLYASIAHMSSLQEG